MADVLSKTNLVSPSHQTQQPTGIHVAVPKSFGLKGFPLDVKPPALRWQTSSLGTQFNGRRVVLQGNKRRPGKGLGLFSHPSVMAQAALRLGTAQIWWEKGLQPNMKEVTSAQELVDSLLHAGDKLVVVDFFSPGCGGCRVLHPKICQLAEMNPDVQFLQVNHEEHKSMCYSLNVHVLPFFRFYRGAHGRLCSFSCTNATIKKFKDALAKHSPDRCSLGPAKGLEEKELLALAANKDLSFTYAPKPAEPELAPTQKEMVTATATSQSNLSPPLPIPLPLPLPTVTSNSAEESMEKTLVTSGR